MKTLLSIAALVAVLLLTLLLLPGPAPESGGAAARGTPTGGAPPTAITNVRLFDGEQVIEQATLLLADGRVQAAGRDVAVPAGAQVVDGRGRTALPGLVDAHVHVFGPAREDALRFGVTTLLDMFRPPTDAAEYRAERASLAPTARADLFSAGYLATAPGGHGTQYGFPVPTPTTADADDWVAARLAEGSDYIKIVIEDGASWGGELPTLAPDTVRALVRAAHARGVLAVAHVSTRAAALLALEAGADGLMHLFVDAPADAQFIAAAREAGAWVVPTAAVLAASHGHAAAAPLHDHPELGARLSVTQRQSLGQAFPGAAARRPRWPMIMDSVRALHEAGVPLLAGSDAPNPGTAQGASLHEELAWLVAAGLAPQAALRAATAVPAAVFGLAERGCLKAGCRADVLLVDGNPLDDIGATTRIAAVWKNGHAVALEPAAAPAPRTPAAARDVGPPLELLAQPGRWMAASDQYQQGQSSARLVPAEAADGGLVVAGTLRTGFAFPYAGAMWNASEVPMQATDLSGRSALELELAGAAASYRVMFFSGEQGAQPTWRDVPAGQLVRLEFAELPGVDLARLRAIGVFVSGQPGDFEFAIREARLH